MGGALTMSERFELEQNLNRICNDLQANMGNAALVHMVGKAAGLSMALDPKTNEPRSMSSARELTARFLEETRSELRAAGCYKFEEKDPPYFELVDRVMEKAVEYKASFRNDPNTGIEHNL